MSGFKTLIIALALSAAGVAHAAGASQESAANDAHASLRKDVVAATRLCRSQAINQLKDLHKAKGSQDQLKVVLSELKGCLEKAVSNSGAEVVASN